MHSTKMIKNRSGVRLMSTVSTLPNGVKVASINESHPIATIAFASKFGTKNEKSNNRGISALMGKLAFSGNFKQAESIDGVVTEFLTQRTAQQAGLELSSFSSRDVSYQAVTGIKEAVLKNAKIGGMSYANPSVETWVVNEHLDSLKANGQRNLDDLDFILDDFHAASFRGGLSNNMAIEGFQYNQLSQENVFDCLDESRTLENTAVIGVGVTHAELVEVANTYLSKLTSGGSSEKSIFKAREVRTSAGGATTHVILGFDCTGINASAVGVIKHALGSFKSSGANVKAITSLYEETGVLGIYSQTVSGQSGSALGKVVAELSGVASKGFSSEAIANAKKAFSRELLAENGQDLLVSTTKKVFGKEYLSNTEMAKSVSALTESEINTIVKKLLKSSPSLAARGQLSDVPYLDSIKL